MSHGYSKLTHDEQRERIAQRVVDSGIEVSEFDRLCAVVEAAKRLPIRRLINCIRDSLYGTQKDEDAVNELPQALDNLK